MSIEKDRIQLFHTGFFEIKEPDIYYGRRNADFGQGFYLTDDYEFSRRWAKERADFDTIVNSYELDTTGLKIKRLERNVDWFTFIYNNRKGHSEILEDIDVIIGPIANDTIYDVFGIPTSGMLSNADSLELLLIGPAYNQIVLKSQKAIDNLKWLSSNIIQPDEIKEYRNMVRLEEESFQQLFAKKLEELIEE